MAAPSGCRPKTCRSSPAKWPRSSTSAPSTSRRARGCGAASRRPRPPSPASSRCTASCATSSPRRGGASLTIATSPSGGGGAPPPAVTGIVPVYGFMRNIIAEAGGRFINDRDVAERRRVAVLGDELAKLLFEHDAPVGQQVLLGDAPFTVVGVMRPKLQNSSYQERDKDRIFIPASTHYAHDRK